MKYLLDTLSLIWFLEDDVKLSSKAKKEIINIKNECFVSIASLWEISIKTGIDKLKLDIPFIKLKDEIYANDMRILPLEFGHLQQLLQLDFHHKDPFDRLIIAQAVQEEMTIITKDENFDKYREVELLW